jgi:hypothetical protein
MWRRRVGEVPNEENHLENVTRSSIRKKKLNEKKKKRVLPTQNPGGGIYVTATMEPLTGSMV